jgi:hypothetical protein
VDAEMAIVKRFPTATKISMYKIMCEEWTLVRLIICTVPSTGIISWLGCTGVMVYTCTLDGPPPET